MIRFAQLLDRLSYTPSRNGKVALMVAYLRAAPDPDRGYALAALTGELAFALPFRKIVVDLVARHMDAELFKISRDYVGDTAETLALVWPDLGQGAPPLLREVASALMDGDKKAAPALLEHWLDALDATGRWALLKFVGGGMRSGVSARLAKIAVAEAFGKDVDAIEQVWHALSPPYDALFAWAARGADLPDLRSVPVFRPLMLSHPLEDADLAGLDPQAYQIEWKWDGIRVQLCARGGAVKLFTRTGDDISGGFPEFANFQFDATLDGELLVARDSVIMPFNDLQQRLNRKTVSKKMMADYPALIRFYDILDCDGTDLRSRAMIERRVELEAWHAAHPLPNTDLSGVLHFADLEHLRAAWLATRDEGIEGMMLKRRDSAYVSGRPKGLWWKWKRSALTIDCVMIYAQRGSGKRSSFYSDYTFAVWDDKVTPRVLVPVAKAYSGFTDEELRKLDHFVRHHTTGRFGPVRQLEAKLVVELAFDAVQKSKRHKSGVAMRFPRISRIRWDKPVEEADQLSDVEKLIPGQA